MDQAVPFYSGYIEMNFNGDHVMDWDDVPNAVRYWVQVGRPSTLGGCVAAPFTDYDVDFSQVTVTGLDEGTTYHWRVKAMGDCNVTADWSM